MGTKFVLPNVRITDTSAPKIVEIDELESSGSLLLIEPGHPDYRFSSPLANGVQLPNILSTRSTKITGSSNTDAPFIIGPQWASSTNKIERSHKGGIHLINGQVATSDGTKRAHIILPLTVAEYILSKPTNKFFFSFWARQTRSIAAGSGNILRQQLQSGSIYGLYNRVSASSVFVYPNDANKLGEHVENGYNEKLGPYYGNGARVMSPQFHIRYIDSLSLFKVGDDFGIANTGEKDGSYILYRLYVEDLTASGRTHAQVDALDYALYRKHVVEPGGRYYNDTTPTAPSTIE